MCEALGKYVTGCLIVIPVHTDYTVWLLKNEMCEALGRYVTGCLIVIPAHADYAVWLLKNEMCEALGLWRETRATELTAGVMATKMCCVMASDSILGEHLGAKSEAQGLFGVQTDSFETKARH